jgi:hypothetical protein
VYPPYVFKESAQGVSIRPVPSLELIPFYADLARQIAGLPDGALVNMLVSESDVRGNSDDGGAQI